MKDIHFPFICGALLLKSLGSLSHFWIEAIQPVVDENHFQCPNKTDWENLKCEEIGVQKEKIGFFKKSLKINCGSLVT